MIALFLSCVLAADPHAGGPATGESPAAMVRTANLEGMIRALPVKRSAGNDEEHEAGLMQTEALILEQARKLGYEPRTHKVMFAKRIRPAEGERAYRREWQNIILDLPGKELAKEVLIVGAHFDAVPEAPGADDNGTGVAALMEIARVLKNQPMRRTVRMVFFNLEEVGLVGSAQYSSFLANQPEDEKERIVGMISLEMLGCYSDKPGSQLNPFPALKGVELPTVGDFIGLAGLLSARPFIRTLDEQMRKAEPQCKTFVFDLSPLPLPDLLRSDHAPFLRYDIPALMVTDTANFRNKHYHEPTDTIETLDMPRFTSTVRALAGAVHAIAGPVGQPDPPAPNLEGLPDLSKLLAPPPAAPGEVPEKPAPPK